MIAGAAVWGFVNGQASTTEQAYANDIGSSVNNLNEKLSIVDLSWQSSTSAEIWLLNTGQITLQIQQIRVYNSTNTPSRVNLLYNYTLSGGSRMAMVYDLYSGSGQQGCGIAASPSYESPSITSISTAKGATAALTLTIPGSGADPGHNCPSYGASWTKGSAYTVVVVGLYGNTQAYVQVR